MINKKYLQNCITAFLIKTLRKGLKKKLSPLYSLNKRVCTFFEKTTKAFNLKKKTSVFQYTIYKVIRKVSKKVKLLVKKKKYLKRMLLKNNEGLPNVPSNFIFKNTKTSILRIWLKKTVRGGILVKKCSKKHFAGVGLSNIVGFSVFTGRGFPYYKNNFYSLIRHLIDFFLNKSVSYGYTEVNLPVLVKSRQAFNTGQLPDKEEQMFSLKKNNLHLLPTSEISVTNLLNNVKLLKQNTPVLYSSYSLCFRREIGSWGRLNKGLNRVHQFDKVELVKVVSRGDSNHELASLHNNVSFLLEELNITYRVISVCKTDLSFSANKQVDIEVWLYGQQQWLEVSSCSNITDFQSRRLQLYILYKNYKELAHTLNGSGLAIQRIIVSILENSLLVNNVEVEVPCILKYSYLHKNIGL